MILIFAVELVNWMAWLGWGFNNGARKWTSTYFINECLFLHIIFELKKNENENDFYGEVLLFCLLRFRWLKNFIVCAMYRSGSGYGVTWRTHRHYRDRLYWKWKKKEIGLTCEFNCFHQTEMPKIRGAQIIANGCPANRSKVNKFVKVWQEDKPPNTLIIQWVMPSKQLIYYMDCNDHFLFEWAHKWNMALSCFYTIRSLGVQPNMICWCAAD